MTPHQHNRQPVPASDTAAICLRDALTVLRGQRLVIDRLTHQQEHGELYFNRGKWGWKVNIVAQHCRATASRVWPYRVSFTTDLYWSC